MKTTELILVAALALIFAACGDDGNGGGPECNNDVLETGESCDTTQMGGETCEGLGYFTGDLGCTEQCTFDESSCTNCGNGTKDEGEMCDDQDLDNKDCTDLDYDGGDLACNSDCTFNGEGCYACGNNHIEVDEECDREDFGIKTCKTEGYDGGDLLCTDNCVIDESQCYDCGGTDPCEAEFCSGHGSCRVANCVPYCECDAGYTPGVDLDCLEEGTCGNVGEDCDLDADCCMGACVAGYCTGACLTDSDCVNNGTDGRDMCCVWGDPYFWCQKTAAAGVSCGDHSGTCGTSCAAALSSACADNNICMGWGEDDPNAVCGNLCTTDADCDICGTPGDFECVQSFCFPAADPCDSTDDCTDPQVCGIAYNAAQDGFEGACYGRGGAATGAVCDLDPHPWDERCASGLCLNGHCSEWCQDDLDCAADMLCSYTIFCLEQTCTELAPAPMCSWMPGSQTDCVSTADCPVHETCTYNRLPLDGLLANKCTAEECDPVSPDCGDVGDTCGQGLSPCAGKLCLNGTLGSWCSALCDADAQCPVDMYCGPMLVDTQIQGVCAPGTPCTSTADCPAGEACNVFLGLQDDLIGVCLDNGPDPIGTDCNPQAPTCKGYCLNGKCSEVCAADADCGGGGACAIITFCLDQECTGYANIPMCVWTPGSHQACVNHASCPGGEICAWYRDVGDVVHKVCITENCDPVDADCLAVGGPCGTPPQECWGGLCISHPLFVASHCSQPCDAATDCSGNMVCVSMVLYDGPTTGVCFALPGSQDPCATNVDCTGEVCMPIDMVEGSQTVCITPLPTDPLCTMCTTDADCGGSSVCIASVANPGENYCGLPCPNGDECPTGYTCANVGGAVNNCMPQDDSCIIN
ncbi:hypothetical protein ACFL2F_04085 [Myxococcota bacterium]